jgi:hypothetical protein
MNRFRIPVLFLAVMVAMPLSSTAATYEWTFNGGNLGDAFVQGTMQAVGATVPSIVNTNGTTIPHIGGVQARVLSVPAFTAPADGFNLSLDASGPNGLNGAYINQYTFIFDIYSPGARNWQALFQTDPENTTTNNNDADWYISPSGQLGIFDLGYSAEDAIQQETWYRIAFSADLAAGRVTYYINGVNVHQSFAGVLDGRFALYSNVDPGADVRLFNEGDTSGVYTHELYVNSVAFVDREMTESEIASLGAASAGGILIPEPTAGLLAIAGLTIPLLRRRR